MDIIVTGASKGIGYEIVKKFVATGNFRILACARSEKKLAVLEQEVITGTKIIPLVVDLSSETGIQALLEKVKAMKFKPKILINNAGYLVNKPFKDLEGKDFDQIFNINVKAVFLLVKSLLPYFEKDSHIVNIGSMGGFQGSAKFPGLSLYSASKGALAILTECLAEELKDKNIKVNCLALGAAQTEMLAEAFPGFQAPVSAAEMANFITNFARNGQLFFNGKILPVSLSTP